jgi:hypothetical protein
MTNKVIEIGLLIVYFLNVGLLDPELIVLNDV